MNKRELVKLLKNQGFEKLPKLGKGSHERWTNGKTVITVPKPSKTDYPPGTLGKILKQVGLK